jgi:hypothetical protein
MTLRAQKLFPFIAGSLLVTLAFVAGRASVSETERERQCIALVDDMVLLTQDLQEQLHAIPDCDCPGPEECDIEATCNRDAMICCMILARQETGEP